MSQQRTEESAPGQPQADYQANILAKLAELTKGAGQAVRTSGLEALEQILLAAAPTSDLCRNLASALAAAADQLAWHKAVLDNLPFPVNVFDQSDRRAYLNQPAEALLAGGKNETHELLPLPAGQPDSREGGSFVWRQPDSGRVYEGQAAPIRDRQGRNLGRLEILRDITDSFDNSERTRLILDSMPLAFTVWDDGLQRIACNKAVTNLFGQPDQQDFLEQFAKFSPEFQPNGRRSADLAKEYLAQALEEGSKTFEWVHRKPDGTLIPCEVRLVRAPWRDRFIVAGYLRDLLEVKKAQTERDSERKLLNRIMDSAPLCFAITVGGLVKFITPFSHHFTGLRLGDDISEIYQDEMAWDALNEELRERGFVNWRPVEIRRADGQTCAMLLNAFQAEYDGLRGVMNWFMDINELTLQAEDLKKARDAAEASTRAKSEFLANMSHEIRTPMNAILGLLHLAQETELSDTQEEYLQKIEDAAKSLLRIINDILDFSKIEAGRLEMEEVDFNLIDVLQTVANINSTKAGEKGLKYTLQVAPDTPVGLVGDPVRLTQILSNLSSNAIKFTAKGQVTLEVSIAEEKPDSVTLKFETRDTGIGLSSAQLKNLFQAFTQADTSHTRRFGGTGLGLTICKRLAEMMGGRIWVESVPEAGSTFAFTAAFGIQALGGRYREKALNLKKINEKPAVIKEYAGARILLVEDNEVNQLVASRILKNAGLEVDIANNGLEGVRMVQEKAYDLVLMDIQMPEMDGHQATAEIRSLGRFNNLPIVAMTAHAMSGDHESSLQAGMNDHITKPINLQELFTALARWLKKTD